MLSDSCLVGHLMVNLEQINNKLIESLTEDQM